MFLRLSFSLIACLIRSRFLCHQEFADFHQWLLWCHRLLSSMTWPLNEGKWNMKDCLGMCEGSINDAHYFSVSTRLFASLRHLESDSHDNFVAGNESIDSSHTAFSLSVFTFHPVSPFVRRVFESFVARRTTGNERRGEKKSIDLLSQTGWWQERKKEFQRLHHNESLLIDSVSFWVKKERVTLFSRSFAFTQKQSFEDVVSWLKGIDRWSNDRIRSEKKRTKSSNSISGPWSLHQVWCNVWFNTRSFHSLCFLFLFLTPFSEDRPSERFDCWVHSRS